MSQLLSQFERFMKVLKRETFAGCGSGLFFFIVLVFVFGIGISMEVKQFDPSTSIATSPTKTHLATKQSTPTPRSVVKKTPTHTPRIVTPSLSRFPLEATPVSPSSGVVLAIDFLIEDVELRQDTIKFNITVKRKIDKTLSWTSDESRKDKIYLKSGSDRYDLVDMGGIFTQNTTLQPHQSYEGWLVFEKPDQDAFTFYYPDVQPLRVESDF